MFSLRRLLAVLILLAVLALGVVIWRHLQQQSPLQILEALPQQVDLAVEKLHYTQNVDGQRSWTLDADRAEYQRDNSQAALERVQLTLYEAGQFGDVTLSADRGLLEQEKRQVEVSGQVVVSTAKGERLYTERLHYADQQRLLSTDEPVRLVTPQMELTGIGMRVDLNRGTLLLKKDVWMLLLPAERKTKRDE